MIRRGWAAADLMPMTIGEFRFWLDTAVAAAKEEAEEMKRASGR